MRIPGSMEWEFLEKEPARAEQGRGWRLSKKAEYLAAWFSHRDHHRDAAVRAWVCLMSKEKQEKLESDNLFVIFMTNVLRYSVAPTHGVNQRQRT